VAEAPPVAALYENLSEDARRHLKAALDNGDRWGYRCSGIFDAKSIILHHGGRYWKWGDLVSAGFLTSLGVAVAKAADTKPKRGSRDL
jgi:hypothetical protein